jgi:hypothetical protein
VVTRLGGFLAAALVRARTIPSARPGRFDRLSGVCEDFGVVGKAFLALKYHNDL